jgi:hypothetical protein
MKWARQTQAFIFVGWVVDSFVITIVVTIFVIASALYLSFYHCLPFPFPLSLEKAVST